ncbi:MAG: 3-oxoacyl-ACP synthase III [Planctomycetaceae bacterium]|jgi:acyl-CoA:acyl-CoA alkyltransferase|nr:3-oxoacyl-ACP synthase III [Planctomycetaceae bacterium]MBT4012513.1 3-oxoacyl-ACP synthase III [Planctomycetaceae bacterium]MBT4724291.1 3-oxoacyl-ACP synthase III [Planctomycetaceae bacterium]MBT4846473.1 3-oxoacyl-ACP synthase III [Planctomycetaceae bacterium]MBT5125970.1 3-oxoacyl-ACP synthase III [Planctomycetaceae bacterium]
MQYNNVFVESLGYTLPAQVLSTADLEKRLDPVYQRLSLPVGRLELMTGIKERRFWQSGVLPGDKSIESGQQAIAAADFDVNNIGMLIHGSVCRDHLEPATSCRVHHALGLPSECTIYDVSNACLGQLNGIISAANAIELGQVAAALVVGTEDSRALVENTIESLNSGSHWTRKTIKKAVASLTIGSASSAILLTNEATTTTGNRLCTATAQANTQHHTLCQSGKDEAVADNMKPFMHTDSETLMVRGIETGVITFARFLDESNWTRADIDKTVCHQVGSGHRKLMLESLGLPPEKDSTTFQWLGNTGSAALPVTWAFAAKANKIESGDKLALLGIGSGINCIMLGLEWNKSVVGTNSIR